VWGVDIVEEVIGLHEDLVFFLGDFRYDLIEKVALIEGLPICGLL